MICPTCNGNRKLGALGFNHDRRACLPVVLDCQDCHQTGKVDDRHPQWKVIGIRLKDARIDRRETLRNFCMRTGVDPILRSAQERGFVDPSGAEI